MESQKGNKSQNKNRRQNCSAPLTQFGENSLVPVCSLPSDHLFTVKRRDIKASHPQ